MEYILIKNCNFPWRTRRVVENRLCRRVATEISTRRNHQKLICPLTKSFDSLEISMITLVRYARVFRKLPVTFELSFPLIAPTLRYHFSISYSVKKLYFRYQTDINNFKGIWIIKTNYLNSFSNLMKFSLNWLLKVLRVIRECH